MIMKRTLLLAALTLAALAGPVRADAMPAMDADETESVLPLIPYPSSLTRGEGTLNLSSLTTITYDDAATQSLAADFAAQLQTVAGLTLSVTQGSATTAALSFVTEAQSDGDEAYTLDISTTGIVIKAQAQAGFFYGVQTLKQLLPTSIYGTERDEAATWQLPVVSIADAPLLGHRGFMLDVARHFFDMDEVKKLLDVAAVYKLNRFHWHLTDDQGWRVEIPEYPKLTTVGAIRKRSLVVNDPSRGTTFYDDTEYGRGCYYTLDQLAEIVAYAKERHIEIIPEVDMPGHMVAAITAYPELSCDADKTYEVRSEKGISSDVLNIGNDSVISFLKCVLGHIAEVFPYQYIHLGGDECPTDVWEVNAECQARITSEGLTDVDDLQPWLVETLGSWLKSEYGKDVIAWDELIANWNDDYTVKPVIMAWHSTSYTASAATKGFKSICVPYLPLYFDQLQAEVEDLEVDEPYMGGYGDGTVNTVEEVYTFNPLTSVSGREEYVLGTQANLWTESCASDLQAEYQYFPRLLALSETAWLPVAKKSYSDFYNRLQANVKILDEKGVAYAKHFIEETALSEADSLLAVTDTLLAQTVPGAVGYPSQAAYDALAAARQAFAATATPQADDIATLNAAIAAYEAADIVLPEAGKMYQIVSASTYYRTRYNGSTVYAAGDGLNFHYTPQLEPEELWYITPQETGGYVISHAGSGLNVTMPTYEEELELTTAEGTPVRFEVPTEANGDYTYIPGVMTITAWADSAATDARRFYGSTSGTVIAYNSVQLCTPVTWRLKEVTDYALYLQSLYDKCVLILKSADPTAYGEPTQEALDFLQESLVTPMAAALTAEVTEDIYKQYVALYLQYLNMPTVTIFDALDESHLYRIYNVDFTDYYACANTSTGSIQPKTLASDDNYKWVIRKNDDATVTIYNVATGTGAFVASSAQNRPVRVGRAYNWTLKEVTTDSDQTGIAIVDETDTYSWYTNPSGSWNYLILKPYNMTGSIWAFQRLSQEVPTGIERIVTDADTAGAEGSTDYYDLTGRRVASPARGIYLTGKGEKIVVK